MRKPRQHHIRRQQAKQLKATAASPPSKGGLSPFPDREVWMPAPKIRRDYIDVSAVTWWRWRHDPNLKFPLGKLVRGRWYFPLQPVLAWWAERSNGGAV
jgi:hypothetical protein